MHSTLLVAVVLTGLACISVPVPAAQSINNPVNFAWRHQFSYFLSNKTTAAKAHVAEVLQRAIDRQLPGVVKSYSWGGDFGLKKKNYANATLGPNADFAGRVDFVTKQKLQAFWANNLQNEEFLTMLKDYVHEAWRIQYLTYNANALPTEKGYYYQAMFGFRFANSTTANVTSAYSQWAIENWLSLIQKCPSNPYSTDAGADLRLGAELYPTLQAQENSMIGGGFLWRSEADHNVFSKWLFAQPEYQEITAGTGQAARVQYVIRVGVPGALPGPF